MIICLKHQRFVGDFRTLTLKYIQGSSIKAMLLNSARRPVLVAVEYFAPSSLVNDTEME